MGAAEPTAEAEPTTGASTASPMPTPTTSSADDLFTYVSTTPVPLSDVDTYEAHGIDVRDVTYPSPGGGDVLALLAEPTEDATDVGMLMTHDNVGLTNQVESRESYLDAVARFACAGATAIVVDAPWSRDPARSHDTPFTFTRSAQNVDERVQMITDLRRAVDVLEQHGAEQIGFTATGSGAGYGAMLAGVEPRVDAFTLLGGGAGPAKRYIGESGAGIGPAAGRTQAELQAWADQMRPLAPATLVGDATSPMLFIVGRDDQVFTVEEVKAVSEAAGDVAELRVHDTGRTLDSTAFHEQLDWLADHLGLDQDRVDACFEDAAAYVEGPPGA